MKKSLPSKWLAVPIVALAANFFWRLIDQSQLMRYFPLDFVNDISSYMAQLHFLKACGFLKFCPYWYNGFIAFKFTPPAWYFFTYPLYLLFGDVKVATYVSMVLIFVLAFVIIYYFGGLLQLSRIKRIAFFFFLFGNAVAIGNFIRLGRVPELFAWLNFLAFAFVVLWYKDHAIDKKYFLTIPFFSLIILSHQVVSVLAMMLLAGLFLIKNTKDKIIVFLSAIVSFSMTSFWLVPYVRGFNSSGVVDHIMTKTLFFFDSENILQNIATFVVPVALWLLFYFYWQSHDKSRKELVFFSPVLIISALLFFRITYFVPVLRYVYPDPHIMLFLFVGLFLFFKTDFAKFPRLRKFLYACIILAAALSILISNFYTPFSPKHGQLDSEILSALPYITTDDKFLILGTQATSYPKAYYAYASTYMNLSSSSGWYPEVKENNYMAVLRKVGPAFEDKKPEEFTNATDYLNITAIISYYDYCNTLRDFGWQEIVKTENVCLYKKAANVNA